MAPGDKPGEHEDRTIYEVGGLSPGATQAGKPAASLPSIRGEDKGGLRGAGSPWSSVGEEREGGEGDVP